jgi:signal transduction histidine kinase
MRWPIRFQLLLPVLLLLAGMAAVSAGAAYAASRAAHRQLEDRFRAAARAFDESTFPLNGPVLDLVSALSGAQYLLDSPVLDRRARSSALQDATVPPGAPLADHPDGLTLGGPAQAGGTSYLVAAVRLHRRQNAGDTLYILYPEALWLEARWAAMYPSLLIGAVVGAAAVVLAALQARWLGRRILGLEAGTRRIASGDFSPLPLTGPEDELRGLARSINEMSSRIAALQDAIRRSERLRLLGQVSAGLAHELRNGLTGARLAVQLHLMEAGEAEKEEDGPLHVALRQLSLLEAQVQRLLGLGKAGAPARQPHDLAALLRESASLLAPRCRHAGIGLTCEPAGPLVAEVDAGQWGQLVVNLLGNAIDAAGPGGQVEARLSSSGGKAVLEVLDSGPGPSEEIAARLFEPFATTKPEGVGLGLAAARDVAEGHGGSLTWSRVEGRTCFRAEVPLRVE